MILLSEEQLNNLDKEALVILFSSLQDQLVYVQKQLDTANEHLSDNNKQIELLTEQIRILNQRHFGRKSESALTSDEGQMTIFDFFNEAEYLVKQDLNEPEITEVVVSSYRRSNKTKGKREADLEEIYKRLHIIPETFIVDEHHVHVYASKKNTGVIRKASRPADLFRNSIATSPGYSRPTGSIFPPIRWRTG